MSRELNVLLLGMSYVKVNGVDGICRSPDIAIIDIKQCTMW
jgi:hypothetical protein